MSQAISNPFELHEQLVGVINYSKKSFVLVGKLLHELKEKGSYKKAVGSGIDTWDDYISQPEINLSRSEAERLIQIYEQFVLIRGISEERLAEVPIKNLHYLLPIAKRDGADVGELLDAAATLNQRDFKERVGEIKHGEDLHYEFVIFKKCVETGAMKKVHDISSDDIKEHFGLQD